jgi:hypothetical protein
VRLLLLLLWQGGFGLRTASKVKANAALASTTAAAQAASTDSPAACRPDGGDERPLLLAMRQRVLDDAREACDWNAEARSKPSLRAREGASNTTSQRACQPCRPRPDVM